jgi:protein-tyrosine phosphatase
MTYSVTWLTSQLACGSAPMSYDDLDLIKGQGINAIVNLCGEFCDLHQIEEQSGFEVYYLPIPDESAPDIQLMEKALDWLDEALYLKKKVLIHCRHGIGRTGTFVSAYLLRRGFGLKLTEKRLKNARLSPGNFSQWRLLRKYGKQKGQLKAGEPSLENKATIDLEPFLREVEAILQEAEEAAAAAGTDPKAAAPDGCCHGVFEMDLIEAVYLSQSLNKQLDRESRMAAIERALAASSLIREAQVSTGCSREEAMRQISSTQAISCPLLVAGNCVLFANRPLRCRPGLDSNTRERLQEAIRKASREIFLALTGSFSPATNLQFSILDTVSGRFVQQYFQVMMGRSSDS